MFNIACKVTAEVNKSVDGYITVIGYLFLGIILFTAWYALKEHVSRRELEENKSKQTENSESNKDLD